MSELATTLVRPRPSPLHSGIGVGTFLTLQILATLFPLTAGLLLFGWRAAGTTAVVVGSAMLTGGRCDYGIACGWRRSCR